MEQTFITMVPNQYEVMLNNYMGILEKTNQQLSLWSNPYGIMVGILTLLVAIGAIIVAWYLQKNSKEQKDLYISTIKNHQKQIEDSYKVMIEEQNIQLQKVVEDFKKVKDSATEGNKKELQSIIKKYEEKILNLEKRSNAEPTKILSSLDTYFPQDFVGLNYPNLGTSRKVHKIICSSCGSPFEYYEETGNYTGDGGVSFKGSVPLYPNNKKVYCTHCGKINYVS